ncbi:hypothetical protein ABZ341_35935 [Streptomyces sp. NPDC006173]|uniref:hypothetical protein n=1 Tax=Streptomyces sp. NPDC006173 TaxID=3155349 RepID=UPI0033DFE479
MSNQDAPQANEGVLSTDDLAAARQGRKDEPPTSADTPPQYPGEAAPAAEREGRKENGGRAAASERREAEPDENQPLLGNEEKEFRSRWQTIQGEFVDAPQEAVNAADQLVAETMQALAATFSEHKRSLESRWNRGEEVQTEDLRLALQSYRSFFNRLLST